MGPLWLVYGRQNGYVQYGRVPSDGRARPRPGSGGVQVTVIAEVAGGSTVVMKAAADTRSYFHFLIARDRLLPAGDTGFTLAACPNGTIGPNGLVTDFWLGFTIEPGRVAPVQVFTSASARPIWLTFTPGKG